MIEDRAAFVRIEAGLDRFGRNSEVCGPEKLETIRAFSPDDLWK
jgi:hypothetical protein